jgi:hypothetical protein
MDTSIETDFRRNDQLRRCWRIMCRAGRLFTDFKQSSVLVIARLDRAIQYSRDANAHLKSLWNADAPRRAGMTAEGTTPHSRDTMCPSDASVSALDQEEGAGNAGSWPPPWAACKQKKQAAVTTGSAESPDLPCATVLTVSFVLPGDRAFLPPSFATSSLARLAPASGAPGPHDFAIRIGIVRPRAQSARATPSRPSNPALTFGDDRP